MSDEGVLALSILSGTGFRFLFDEDQEGVLCEIQRFVKENKKQLSKALKEMENNSIQSRVWKRSETELGLRNEELAELTDRFRSHFIGFAQAYGYDAGYTQRGGHEILIVRHKDKKTKIIRL
ncbi:MAG: hypothetical protein ACOC32_04105 [Nanoarchaeota archaeon]